LGHPVCIAGFLIKCYFSAKNDAVRRKEVNGVPVAAPAASKGRLSEGRDTLQPLLKPTAFKVIRSPQKQPRRLSAFRSIDQDFSESANHLPVYENSAEQERKFVKEEGDLIVDLRYANYI
jgi:hypothetical protein